MHDARASLLILVAIFGCGEDGAGALDGGVRRDARMPDAPIVRICADANMPAGLCPNDPVPCPGTCNARGYCERDCGFGPEIRVPANRVVMGRGAGQPEGYLPPSGTELGGVHPHEDPSRIARITRSFWIDKFETTITAYAVCLGDRVCKRLRGDDSCNAQVEDEETWREWRADIGLSGQHPANCASWQQAQTCCTWKSARLPSEAEWMLAGRGPAGDSCTTGADLAVAGRCNQRPLPWGDERDPRRLHVLSDEDPAQIRSLPVLWRGLASTPVGFFDGSLRQGRKQSYQTQDGSSHYGLHDMAGNLFEWLNDWWDPEYGARAPLDDPRGPEIGTERVLMSLGYTILDFPFRALSAKAHGDPNDHWNLSGFRCVRDAER